MVQALAEAGLGCGDEAEIACMDPPGKRWLENHWTVHGFGPVRSRFGYSSRFATWLLKNGARFDAIIVHGLWQFHGVGVWRAGLATPYVVFAHGMLDVWFRQAEPWKHLKKRFFWPLQHAILRRSRALLFTTEEERERAQMTFGRLRCRQVVVGGGIPASPTLADEGVAFRSRFPQLGTSPYLLFLGRLHPKKGCDLLVEAYGRWATPHLPHLVLAGPDECGLQEKLRASVPYPLRSQLHFTGLLTGALKWSAIEGCEAMVMPSHQENYCLSIVEGLSRGRPCLVSRRVNIWREIESHQAGITGDDSLAGTLNLLRRWHTTGTHARQTMAANAQTAYLKCFRASETYQRVIASL
jgi:glycosyltransferase involved in cell wall biosynthesis